MTSPHIAHTKGVQGPGGLPVAASEGAIGLTAEYMPWHAHTTIWGLTCEIAGCDSHGLVYTVDGTQISRERSWEVAQLNGWLRTAPGKWLCPQHAPEASA